MTPSAHADQRQLVSSIEKYNMLLAWFISKHITHTYNSVPARPISEGAAPCPYCIAPCPICTVPCPNLKKKKILNYFFILQNVIAVFVFSDSRCKNACKMLADLCPCFHQSLTKLCQDLVSFACWMVTKFWSFTGKRLGHSRSKLCPILCRLRSKLCPNFGRSRTRLSPISFAPCPFPILAGTLLHVQLIDDRILPKNDTIAVWCLTV